MLIKPIANRRAVSQNVKLKCDKMCLHNRSTLQLLFVGFYRRHEHPQELFVGVQSVQLLTCKVSNLRHRL